MVAGRPAIVATADTLNGTEDTPIAISFADILGNDLGGGAPLTIDHVGAAVGGTVSLDTVNKLIHFTPDADFNGVASFVYSVTDGITTQHGTVNLQVAPVADAAVVKNDVVETQKNQPIVIPVGALTQNDSSVDGTLPPVTAVGGAVHGQVSYDAVNGLITFTPANNFKGIASFTLYARQRSRWLRPPP